MGEALAGAVNSVLKGIVAFVNTLVSWMPDSPFRGPIEAISSGFGSDLLGYLNYFLPISEFLAVLGVWVAAIVLYYVVSVIFRWVKAIS